MKIKSNVKGGLRIAADITIGGGRGAGCPPIFGGGRGAGCNPGPVFEAQFAVA